MTYPSTKVSFVLEENNELSSGYVGILGGNSCLRLLIVGISQRVRRAVNHQLSLFPRPTVRPIRLEQPRPSAGYKLSSRTQSPCLFEQRAHTHGCGSLGETISLENWQFDGSVTERKRTSASSSPYS